MKIGGPQDYLDGRHLGYRRLMSQIMINTIRDYWQSKNLADKLDAAYWLAGPDAKIYCDALEIDQDPLKPVLETRDFNGKQWVEN